MKESISITLSGRQVDFIKSENGDFLRTVKVSAIEGAEVKKIGFSQNLQDWLQAQSALSALEAHLRFHRYDNPGTTRGLHLLREANLHEDGTNLGVVSTTYEGDVLTPPAPGQYPGDWAQINRMNGRFFLSGFPEQGRYQRCRKHDWIDFIQVDGCGAEIGVTPWNNSSHIADSIMAEMLEKSDEKATQMLYARYDQVKMLRTARRLLQQHVQDERHGVFNPVKHEPIMLMTTEGNMIDLFSLEPCQIQAFDAYGNNRIFAWNGSWRSIETFRGIATAKGWTIEPMAQ